MPSQPFIPISILGRGTYFRRNDAAAGLIRFAGIMLSGKGSRMILRIGRADRLRGIEVRIRVDAERVVDGESAHAEIAHGLHLGGYRSIMVSACESRRPS